MRIAQVSTLCTPVRAKDSASVEGLVWLLTRELTRLGHEVTVFGAAGSEVCGELVATLPGPYGEDGSPDDWHHCEWINLCRAVEQSGRFDVLHSHAYLWGLPLQPFSRAPMVHTMHIAADEDSARLWSLTPDACVTAISRSQWRGFPQLRPAATIYHGIDSSQFTFRPQPEEYVCYLGNFRWRKGPLEAIAVARALDLRLLLAGAYDHHYIEDIAPLVDGRSVEYVGYVSGSERDQLLGGARALLYPIQAPEPFGLVQVEAMMCGTPVAALRVGAVPEIIDQGVTGYYAESVDDLAQAVLRSFTLDRYGVWQKAQARFSAERMAREYAQVFERVCT